MGGPASYTNDELERIHSHLKIDERAFTEMTALLREALEDHEINESDIDIICNAIKSKGKFIITRK